MAKPTEPEGVGVVEGRSVVCGWNWCRPSWQRIFLQRYRRRPAKSPPV